MSITSWNVSFRPILVECYGSSGIKIRVNDQVSLCMEAEASVLNSRNDTFHDVIDIYSFVSGKIFV